MENFLKFFSRQDNSRKPWPGLSSSRSSLVWKQLPRQGIPIET